MTNKPNIEVFHRAFSSRTEVATAVHNALEPPSQNLFRLQEASEAFESTMADVGQGDVETQYRAYMTATSIFTVLAEWKHAIRNAETDASRFLASAKIKASEIDRSTGFGRDERLSIFLDQIEALQTFEGLAVLNDQLVRWDLPLLMFADLTNREFHTLSVPASNDPPKISDKLNPTVAFLKFEIDGEAAKQWNYLAPGTAYDLTIEVRVSNWPGGANSLSLIPVTIDAREQGWLPDFRFEKTDGDGPFIFTGTKRAVLEAANSFGSRPYEFKYAAEFDDVSTRSKVAIVGHRQLRLEGTDVAANPLTGFSNIDRHLLKIRDRLRAFPGLHPSDLASTMVVLGGLGNIAAQALKQGMFESETSEKQFQKKATELLRNRSDIGEDLQSHAEAAGGITDLSFKDIPIELKVENRKVLFPKDFEKFFNQTAAYSLGFGKRIGVLSVLEATPKSSPIGVVENDIELFSHQSGESTIAIIVVVIRGGFPKPSAYSR